MDTPTIKLPVVDGSDLRFNRLSTTKGLSQTRVSPILQDDTGFIWFGTQYGLNRYDGYKYKVFKHEPGHPESLSGVYVRSLFKDRSGTLWVGCDEALDRFDPINETFTHFRVNAQDANEPAAPVVQMSEDDAGMLWLATARGLFKLNPSTGQSVRYLHDPNNPNSLGSNYVTFTDADRHGTFWVADGAGLEAFDQKTGKVTLRIPFSQQISFSFHEDKFGLFWITRTYPHCALASFDWLTNKVSCYSLYEDSHPITKLAGIFTMLESQDGTMWFATAGQGLLKFDREHNRLIRYRNHAQDNESLAADNVICLYEDREKNIWAGLHQTTPNYFSEKPPPFENYTHQRGNLGGVLVSSIYEDRNRILWIGSTGALNRIDRDKRLNTVPRGVAVKGEILSIVEDPRGVLVAGTYREGLHKLDPATGQVAPYQPHPEKPSNLDKNPIMRLMFDHAGVLWAATWGGLGRYDPLTGSFAMFKPDSQNTVDYSDIKEDSQGSLWLGGETGLQHFDPVTGKFKIYKHNPDDLHSVSDNRVTSVYLDRSGDIWLGTQNGLDRFDPKAETFQTYYQQDGLAGNVASCILEDERGALWIGTNNGLSSFDPATRQFKNFSAADGLPGPDLSGWSSCFKSRQGEMFFGGFSGATAFYPDRIAENSYTPRTVLTELQLSGLPVSLGGNSPLKRALTYTSDLTLTHLQNIFSIQFSALSYFNVATNRYRYKLDGLDSQWHEVGSDQRVASYTTLPTGHYTFRVQGATARGDWSEPGAVLRIQVLPPWWASWWFRTLYSALLVLLLVSVYRYRLHQITHHFSLRLDERVTERTRMARELHDTLLQTIQASKMVADDALEDVTDIAGARAAIKRLSTWLGQATEEGRAALNSLRGSAAPGCDLLEALRREANEFMARGPMTIEFVTIGESKEMHALLREEVHRIACEAIRNAWMHSEARGIRVQVSYSEHFALRVKDDGKGIAQEIVERGRYGHYGLQGMKERTLRVGGKFNLVTAPAAGTEITLRIPGILIFKRPVPRPPGWLHGWLSRRD